MTSAVSFGFIHICKCIVKIGRCCTHRENKTYILGMIIFTVLYSVADIREVKMADDLVGIFKGTPGYTIQAYVSESLRLFLVKLMILIFSDVATAKFFFTSLKMSLKDIMALEWTDFHSYTTAELLNRQHEKGESAVVIIYYALIYIVNNTVGIVLTISHIMEKTTHMFGVGMIGLTALHFGVFCMSIKILNRFQKRYFAAKNHSRSLVESESSNFNIIKTYNLEKSSEARVGDVTRSRFDIRLRHFIVRSRYEILYKLLEMISIFHVLVLNYSGVVSGDFLDATVTQMLHLWNSLRILLTYLTKLNEQFYIFCALEAEVKPRRIRPVQINSIEAVECMNLSVPGLFYNISFSVRRNEKMAVVGTNGSGKTTLLRMLTGLLDYNGSIKVGGRELSEVDRTCLYSHITAISQSDSYTDGSVMDNLKYGNMASEDEIIAKCVEFGVHQTFSSFENGYLKTSNSLGTELSGGQRQRVSFMRGVLRPMPVLIVDDCLSGVNTNDRRMLLEKLIRQPDKTVIAVCNIFDIFDQFDKILLFGGGSVRFGTFEELRSELEQLTGACDSSTTDEQQDGVAQMDSKV